MAVKSSSTCFYWSSRHHDRVREFQYCSRYLLLISLYSTMWHVMMLSAFSGYRVTHTGHSATACWTSVDRRRSPNTSSVRSHSRLMWLPAPPSHIPLSWRHASRGELPPPQMLRGSVGTLPALQWIGGGRRRGQGLWGGAVGHLAGAPLSLAPPYIAT